MTDFRKPQEWSKWRQTPSRSKVHRFRYEQTCMIHVLRDTFSGHYFVPV